MNPNPLGIDKLYAHGYQYCIVLSHNIYWTFHFILNFKFNVTEFILITNIFTYAFVFINYFVDMYF